MSVVLFQYSFHIATSVSYVTLQPSGQSDVWIRIDKHFHIQQVQYFLVMKC